MELQLTYNSLINNTLKKLGTTTRNFTIEVHAEKEKIANDFLKLLKDEVLVEAKANQEIFKGRGAITVLGQTVAKASGRDSGAFIPKVVSLMSGNVNSGGSMKNWGTCADDGTTFQFRIPRYIFDKNVNRYSNWDIKIINADSQTLDDIL